MILPVVFQGHNSLDIQIVRTCQLQMGSGPSKLVVQLRTGFHSDAFVNVSVVFICAMLGHHDCQHCKLAIWDFLPLSHSYDHHRHSMKRHLPCWLPSCGYRHPPPPHVGLLPHQESYCSPCVSFKLSIRWWPLNDHGRQFFSDDLQFKKSVQS